RKLSELLGGTIWLESRPGSGSKFFLSIPREYRGPSEVTLIGATTSAAEPPMYGILVVEDNFETLYAYEKFLQGTEFRVIPARNLREARGHLHDVRPAAILLDVLIEEETTWP